MKRRILILFSIVLTRVLFYNCSDRFETPTIEKDSTIVYPSKSKNGISAKITLAIKSAEKQANRLEDGTVFQLKKKAKVFATIELTDYKCINQ